MLLCHSTRQSHTIMQWLFSKLLVGMHPLFSPHSLFIHWTFIPIYSPLFCYSEPCIHTTINCYSLVSIWFNLFTFLRFVCKLLWAIYALESYYVVKRNQIEVPCPSTHIICKYLAAIYENQIYFVSLITYKTNIQLLVPPGL